jgi:RNA polymerase sigma-70 factor (ECF subfamily)
VNCRMMSYNCGTWGARAIVDYATIPAEELVLACLESGNESAWSEFVRRFHPLISRVTFRVARQWGEASPQVIDDLIQETYLKLCADRLHALQTFRSTHKDAFYGYIKVFTANLVHDYFKVTHSQKRGGKVAVTSIDEGNWGSVPQAPTYTPATLERKVLIQEVDACLQSVCPGPTLERDRKIFWLYYRDGLAASAIATIPTIGLSTKGVESTILRITRQIRERLGDRTRVSGSKIAKGIQSADSL